MKMATDCTAHKHCCSRRERCGPNWLFLHHGSVGEKIITASGLVLPSLLNHSEGEYDVLFLYLHFPAPIFVLFLLVLLHSLLSLLCNTALHSTALLPNWPMLGWDKRMNRVDLAKWSSGDSSGCENLWGALGSEGTVAHKDAVWGKYPGAKSVAVELRQVVVYNVKLIYSRLCHLV